MNDKMRDNSRAAIDMAADKAKNATDWVADKAENAKEGAIDLAETVQDRAKTLAKGLADTATRAKDKAGEWIADAAEPVQSFVEHGYDDGKKAVQQFGHDATAMIRRYPLTAVAVGLGMGLLIGRAVGHRV
jgi:ElaB/YqjD/DUF883 family membrane-anchored ribosome-binding protein